MLHWRGKTMKATTNADGFATFLGGSGGAASLSHYQAESDWVAPAVSAQAPASAAPSSALRSILHYLAAAGSQPIAALMPLARLPFNTFAAAIEQLRTSDLIRLSGEPGREVVELTPIGRQVALLEL